MEGKRRGYRKIVDEESGSTEQGKKTVIATYRPSRGLSKVVEKDIEYKTSTSPRNKLTIKEKTKKYNDGSVKSYEHIVKQNGNIVPEVTKPKVKYKKGEKPFGQKVDPLMKGYKDDEYEELSLKDERRYARAERKILKAKEKSPEKGIKVEKKYGYNYDAAISAELSPDSTGHWPSRDPATGMILKGRKHPTFYKTKAGEKAAGYKIYKKDGDMYSKPKGANMKGVPHYKKDGTEYKGATHKSGKQLMSGKEHTGSSVNLFHKDEIPGPSMQGSWMRKHIKG